MRGKNRETNRYSKTKETEEVLVMWTMKSGEFRGNNSLKQVIFDLLYFEQFMLLLFPQRATITTNQLIATL